VKREGAGMGVQLISIEGTVVKMEVTIELSRSMLTSEENIQHSLNEVGCMATVAALKYLDTDGSPIEPIWDLFNQLPIFEASGEQNKD
jgi:hypothetical protein